MWTVPHWVATSRLSITYLKTCRPEFHTSSFQLQSNFVSCDIPKGPENIGEREFYCYRHMRELREAAM